MASRRRLTLSLSLSLALLGLLAPAPAHACGGTFCDGQLPNPMPVDQTGEDILFIRDANEIEVHIRIQYVGEAERFAWLVPLSAVPEVTIGSEQLFSALASLAIPDWSTTLGNEGGGPFGGCPPGGCLDLEDGGNPPPPDVEFDEVVGAFEVVVLDAVDAASVLAFFDQNEYFYQPDAAPVIQSYLDEGKLIAAIKLTTNTTATEIHPLVFRFVSDEPCVPIRLTAVAAKDDLGIRAYFLGETRWAPSNYAHVVLNPLSYDWINQSWDDYVELLSLAVDEADGHAFATEFANEHNLGDVDNWSGEWDPDAIANADAHMALDILIGMGLFYPPDPQLIAALREFLPVPQGWGAPEVLFWLQHNRHPALIDVIPFDAPGFAARLDERLFMPVEHANDLLATWPYLTRLHTTLSPEEMTIDPTFHEVPDLPGVDEHRTANGLMLDGADWIRFEVPYDELPFLVRPVEKMCIANTGSFPNFGPWPELDLPKARRIEQLPMIGPAQILVDNSQMISAWADDNYAGSACVPMDPGTGDSESGDGSDSESGGLGLEPEPSRAACACTSEERASGPLALLCSLFLLGFVRRR